jgi:V-type H+-transporting ATPase subunit F
MAKRGGGVASTLVSVIGDEDTVTGFLLTGIGERNNKGESNFLVVDDKTTKEEIESTFKRFLSSPNISIILINQHIAEAYLRPLINTYEGIIPTILEIPSKEHPYDPKKDTIIQKATKQLYGADVDV